MAKKTDATKTTRKKTEKLKIPDKPIKREIKKSRRKYGSIQVPMETVALICTSMVVMLPNNRFQGLIEFIKQTGKDEEKLNAALPQLERMYLQACEIGADLASHAPLIKKLVGRRIGISVAVNLAYYAVRSNFEKSGKFDQRHPKKSNDQIMGLVWEVLQFFPKIRDSINRESTKGEKSFGDWKKGLRDEAIISYKNIEKNDLEFRPLKDELLNYLKSLLGLDNDSDTFARK